MSGARLLPSTIAGHSAYVVPTEGGNFCLFVATLGTACAPPFTDARPAFLVAAYPNPGSTAGPTVFGLAKDGVSSVTFSLNGTKHTAPVEQNVFEYTGTPSANRPHLGRSAWSRENGLGDFTHQPSEWASLTASEGFESCPMRCTPVALITTFAPQRGTFGCPLARCGGHHHHLVCDSCHRVVEVTECDLDAWLDGVVRQHGFVATGHHVEITGLCADCR